MGSPLGRFCEYDWDIIIFFKCSEHQDLYFRFVLCLCPVANSGHIGEKSISLLADEWLLAVAE